MIFPICLFETMKKKITDKLCEIFGHTFGKWKAESDPKRCIFGFGASVSSAPEPNDATFRKMMTKIMTKITKVTRIHSESAAHLPQVRRTSATNLPQIRYTFAPLLQKFRQNLNKNVADLPQTWLPIETSLLIRYEFAALSPQTRYVFIAILLYCGARGTDEIPMDARFLANALAVDERLLKNSLKELEFSNLLLEREKEREEKKEKENTHRQTDARDENGVVVGVNFNSFSGEKTESENQTENEIENGLLKMDSAGKEFSKGSRFTMEDCIKYAKQSDGVKNPNALANNLFQTGNADAFIMAMLYPVEAQAEEAKNFGKPIGFSNDPCSVCFGAKMADTDGKGYRKCIHCRDERGKSTGFEPQGEK